MILCRHYLIQDEILKWDRQLVFSVSISYQLCLKWLGWRGLFLGCVFCLFPFYSYQLLTFCCWYFKVSGTMHSNGISMYLNCLKATFVLFFLSWLGPFYSTKRCVWSGGFFVLFFVCLQIGFVSFRLWRIEIVCWWTLLTDRLICLTVPHSVDDLFLFFVFVKWNTIDRFNVEFVLL